MVLIKQKYSFILLQSLCVYIAVDELTLIQRAKDFLRRVTASRGLRVRTVLIAGSTRKRKRKKEVGREREREKERER